MYWFAIHLEFHTNNSYYSKWTFLLQSRWTKVKGLYIITRHAPFLLLLTVIYGVFSSSTHFTGNELTYCASVCFTPNENPDVRESAVDLPHYAYYLILNFARIAGLFLVSTHVRAPRMHMLHAWPYQALLFLLVGLGVISAACSECISQAPAICTCSWSDSSRPFCTQSICSLEQ